MRLTTNGWAVVEGDLWLSQWAEERGTVKATNDLVCNFNASLIQPGWHVVDAGAALGDHTVAYLEAVGGTGKVIAFEPNPAYFECLRHNCKRAEIHPVGLWSRVALKELQILKDGNLGASHMGYGDACKDVITVAAIPLDSLFLTRLDFYKLDVEGAELWALHGSKDTIARCRPIIQLEVNQETMDRFGLGEDNLRHLIEGMEYTIDHVPGSDGKGPRQEWICYPK